MGFEERGNGEIKEISVIVQEDLKQYFQKGWNPAASAAPLFKPRLDGVHICLL